MGDVRTGEGVSGQLCVSRRGLQGQRGMWRRARCALCARSRSTDHGGLARRSKGVRTVVLRPACGAEGATSFPAVYFRCVLILTVVLTVSRTPVAVVVGAGWRAVTAFGCAAAYLRVERALRVQVA